MIKVGVISDDNSLTNITNLMAEIGIKNVFVHTNQSNQGYDFLFSVCKLLVIDSINISFDLLKQAIKNSCSLFLVSLPCISSKDISTLIKLSYESGSEIYLFDSLICNPQNAKHIYNNRQTTLIDCYINIEANKNNELILKKILLLLAMVDAEQVKNINLTSIPPDLLTATYTMHSKTIARILLNKHSSQSKSSKIIIYRINSDEYNFALGYSKENLKYALKVFISEIKMPKLLPKLEHLLFAQNMLEISKIKPDYYDFFPRNTIG